MICTVHQIFFGRRMKWVGHVGSNEGKRGVYRVLFMDWMELTQDRDSWRALVNAVMNLLVP